MITEANIDIFMSFYRRELPHSRISPKMHMLEDHIVPWIRRWGMGMGFHSEQGAESIHARFNSMLRTYSNIRNPLERLGKVVQEHNLKNLPQLLNLRPIVKRRKANTDSSDEDSN